MKPLLSRAGDIDDFCKHRNRYRVRQNEARGTGPQIEEQDKITAGDLNETEVSNMPDMPFKIMVIKILTRLEKRVGNLSEILNMEIESRKERIRDEALNN